MRKGTFELPVSPVQILAGLLVILALGQPARAQTPGLTDVTVTSTSGTNSVDDALDCSYSLTGTATTAAVAWYRNAQPIMTLYMPFEGGTTVAAQDYSGRSATPVGVGTNSWSATAGHDATGAIEFTGSNWYNVADAFPVNSSYSTVVWAYPTDMTFTLMPVGCYGVDEGHALRIGRDGALTAGQNGDTRIVRSVSGEISINNWYLLGVTYDAPTRTMILYKDGVPMDTSIVSEDRAVVTDPTVQVGALNGTSPFRGYLDDVRIYGAVLTPDQMAALFSEGQSRIAAGELHIGDDWQAEVTPFSATEAGPTIATNTVTIVETIPEITSTPVTEAIAWKAYSYQIEATGGPRPTFALVSGPTGMEVDASTGLVTWTALDAGPYNVSVSAENVAGTDAQDFTIDVAAPTVGVSNVVLTDTPEGDLVSSNDLILDAVTSSTSWLKDGEPLMDLFMPSEGGHDYALEDYSGNGNIGTPFGNPVWVPNGDRNGHGAWEFDGESYIDAGNIFPVHSSYTKAVWIYHTVSGEFNHILSGWDHNLTGTNGHGLRVSYDNRLSAGQNGDWRIVQTDAFTIDPYHWYFAAVTYDFASAQMILYVDGVAVDSAVLAPELRDVSDAGVLVGATQADYAWKGMLDDIRLYDYALTPEQIQNLYAEGGNRILASETEDGQIWQSLVTGYSSTEASAPFASNALTIGVVNQPPTLATIGARSVQETQTLSFSVSASDPDGAVPSLSAAPLPDNASFIDGGNGSGSFTFTPSYDQAGTYDILFIASDGSAADSELVAITVNNLNREPVFATVDPQSIAEGAVLNLPVSATDPDGDELTLSTGTLPANADFVDAGSGSGTLTFAPSYLQAGVYTVRFFAYDVSMSADTTDVEITVTDTPQNSLWLATFTVTGEEVGSALNSADIQLGVQMSSETTWASPTPPEYTAWLGLRDADYDGPYFRDVRSFGDDCYYWILEIDPHGNVAPAATSRCATLSWDPAEFSPDHHYVLRDGVDPDGAILVADMRTVTEYQLCDVQTSRYVTVHWESDACAEQTFASLSLTSGWNLISLPVDPASHTLADLIPSAEIAYGFDGSYQEVTELEPCSGYWVKVPSDTTVYMVGVTLSNCTSALTDGWHMVGAATCTATPETTPVGALQELFGFNGAYTVATATDQGAGYWARVSPDCSFELNCVSAAPMMSPLASGSDADSRLVIRAERVVEGSIGSAYVELGVGDASKLNAPPEAPQYSVRMNLYNADWSGPYYRDVRGSSGTDNLWVLAVNPCGNEGGTATRTVVLSWNAESLGDGQYELREGYDGTGAVLIEDMREVTTFEVSGDNRDQYFSVALTSSAGEQLPSSYVLNQNYPNPFNPSTVIEYSIPVGTYVNLDIFNVLGQKVRTLANESQAAGTYRVEWDGKDESGEHVSTGIYLYRLHAGDDVQTKKMVLMK